MLNQFRKRALGTTLLATLLSLTSRADAIERRFAFNLESRVLPPGEAEVAPWTTVRAGREHHYAAFDQRLEFALGLVPNLQTCLHWNFGAVSESIPVSGSGDRSRVSRFAFQSLSSEWKYEFSDPLADALGFALYGVGSYGPDEAKLEAKVILDKQVRNWLFALNLGGEQAWEVEAGETESAQNLVLSVGAGYFVTPSLVVGVEALGVTTLIEDGEVETSRIHAGPSLAYAAEHYWFVLGAAPQVFAPKAANGDPLDLEHGEQLWARVLVGFHL